MTDPPLFTFPNPDDLSVKPKRCILHWSAGLYESSAFDRIHYHALIEYVKSLGHIRVVKGVEIKNNLRPLIGAASSEHDPVNGYAAHTKAFNSFSIGYSICAMAGALSRESLGGHPLLEAQIDGLITLCAQTSVVFGLEVTPETFFTHWEAEHLHGITQLGKWDITVIPHRPELEVEDVGPWLREEIASRI